MTDRAVLHATFVIERTYDAAPARVFAAWANPAFKAQWYFCNDTWQVAEFELDFRVGGAERLSTGPAGGPAHIFQGRYHDIVPDQRIVYAYEMRLDDARISVSLATIELHPAGRGTRMVFTEQGAFLDGLADPVEREEGTRVGFANLDSWLARGGAAPA